MTTKFDAITDAFERGRLAERARLRETVKEALAAVSELIDALDETGASQLNKVRETRLAPPKSLKREDYWRKR